MEEIEASHRQPQCPSCPRVTKLAWDNILTRQNDELTTAMHIIGEEVVNGIVES